MKQKHVAPDGSCLFYSIDFLFTGEERLGCSSELREVCIAEFQSRPDYYTAELLGEKDTVEEYISWIRNEFTYGGGNEIAVMATHLNIAIRVVSCTAFQPCVILATYGSSVSVAYILYNGQHYDAIVGDDGTRLFAGSEEEDAEAIALASAVKATREADLLTRRRKRLQCSCGTVCEDAASWQAHCEASHADDADFDYLCEEIFVEEKVASALDD